MMRPEEEVLKMQAASQARWREIRDLPTTPDLALERIKLAAQLKALWWVLNPEIEDD